MLMLENKTKLNKVSKVSSSKIIQDVFPSWSYLITVDQYFTNTSKQKQILYYMT